MSNRHGAAVVLGASLTGLLAARALSIHFERITVVEQNVLPEGEKEQKGVSPKPPMRMVFCVAGTGSWTTISRA